MFFAPLQKLTETDGRSSRKELWYFFALQAAVSFFGQILSALTFEALYYILIIWWAVCFVATITLYIRRAHDLGRSGKYVLLMIIPLVNIWISINLVFFDGEGDNQYGTRPIT